MPPQRRKSGPVGPPRRRPKIAGNTRPRSVSPDSVKDASPQDAPPQDASPQFEDVNTAPAPAREEPAATPRPVELGKSAAPRKPEGAEQEIATPAVAEQEAAEQDAAVQEAAGPETPVAALPAETSEDAPPTASDGRSSTGRRPVIVVGAVALVLAVIAVVAAFRPGAEVSNRAWVDAAATREVTEAAQYAIETMHGYDHRTIDEDFAAIRELLTPERLAEFDATAEVTKQAAIQTSTVTVVDVLHIGTSMLDDSRAEVSAYINVSATGDGIAQGSAQAPLLVRMEKSDGRWLVSEIRDR